MKLFHCIVVMGAAMGAGCGAREESAFPPEDGGRDASRADASTADGGCADAGSFSPGPGSRNVGGCPSGTPLAPLGPHDCAHPEQLQCSFGNPPCVCNAGAPLAPTDCATTAEFQCVDWTLPCGCQCVPQAPASPESCGCDAGAPTDAGPVSCLRGTWFCHSYDPPVGCMCSIPIL